MNSPAESQAITDYRLVENARSGDVAAFGELVARYETDVRWFLRQRIRDQATADDLAQDVFLGAMKSISGFQHGSTIRSWLMSIARYKLIDFLRSNARMKTVHSELDTVFDRVTLSQLENSHDYDVETVEILNDCIQRLQPQARQLVEKYYFRDVTAREIAVQNQQKPSTVRMTLLRIRRALARCIRQRTGGGEL